MGHVDHEADSLAKLTTLSPPSSSGSVIAIDLDDVLSQTNAQVALWHNTVFGTNLNLSQFHYFLYWKNPCWGSPATTMAKVKSFYATADFDQMHTVTASTPPPDSAPDDVPHPATLYNGEIVIPETNETPYNLHTTIPVPGAREGVQALRDMGFRLVIVTARTGAVREGSWKWVEKWFNGLFDTMICTGQFEDVQSKTSKGHEVTTKLSKKDVCRDIGAKLLIDDSIENALSCAGYPTPLFSSRPTTSQDPPNTTTPNNTPQSEQMPVLLFGTYGWNRRLSLSPDHSFAGLDEQAFDTRVETTGGTAFLEEDERWAAEVLSGIHGDEPIIHRVRDWGEVVRWVKKAKDEGRL